MMSAFPLQATCSAASSSFNSASSSQLSRVPGGDPPLHRVRLLLLQILLVLLLYRIHVWRYERLLHGVEGAASSSTSLSAYRCFLSGLVSSSLHWGQAVILSEEQELMMCCSLHNASMPLPGTPGAGEVSGQPPNLGCGCEAMPQLMFGGAVCGAWVDWNWKDKCGKTPFYLALFMGRLDCGDHGASDRIGPH